MRLHPQIRHSANARAYVTAGIVQGTLQETLVQNRTHDQANEITRISERQGDPVWAKPAHDLAGNLTAIPRPGSPTGAFICVWDAWNRLVKVKLDENTVLAEYAYDALHRRVKKVTDDEVRHFYYSDQWQVLEERVNAGTTADRQFVWGLRGIDDLLLRDRDTNDDGTLDERCYALHDVMHVTGIVNAATGQVLERYGYNAFGQVRFLDASFAPTTPAYDWETLFDAYRWDAETGLYQVRYRYLHPGLGRWLSRDFGENRIEQYLYVFVRNNPPIFQDINGLETCSSFVESLINDFLENDSANALGHVWLAKRGTTLSDAAGFRQELVAGGQGGAVSRHIYGHGGVMMAMETAVGTSPLGNIVSYINQGIDWAQQFLEGRTETEAAAEIAGDRAGRAVADIIRNAYHEGKSDDCAQIENLRRKLKDILCD